MSLTEANVLKITWLQYLYKLRSYSFVSLIVMQLIILFLSTSGTGMYGASGGTLHVSVKTYGADLVILCTFFWIFITAFNLTKKDKKDQDFTLVANRLTSNLSDVGLLLTFSIIGGITASLSSFLLRLGMYFFSGQQAFINSAFQLPFELLFSGLAGAVLYLFLISACAYIYGMLAEINRFFILIIPALLFVLLRTESSVLIKGFAFFTTESSLLVFGGKVILAAGILFGLSMLIYNRMEVRK